MLIDTTTIPLPVLTRVRTPYRDLVEAACEDLGGYRDIERYISGEIDKQLSVQDMAVWMKMKYYQESICL